MKKLILIAITNIFLSQCFAQDVKDVDAAYADFSIPDASAFTLLGVNPNKVTKPSSTKELSASLLNIASSYKTISPGFAIEWAPLMTFTKRVIDGAHIDKSFDDYRRNFFARNVQLSTASIKDDVGTKFALGLNFAIYDKTDPSYNRSYVDKIFLLASEKLSKLNNYLNANTEYLNLKMPFFKKFNIVADQKLMNDLPSPTALNAKEITEDDKTNIHQDFRTTLGTRYNNNVENKIDEIVSLYNTTLKTIEAMRKDDNKALEKILKETKEEFKKENWNAGALKFGFGNIWNSADDTWKKLSSQKFTGYGAWAFKVAKFGQGILLSQYYYNNEHDSIYKSQFTLGGRFVAGSSKVHGSIEAVWQANAYRAFEGVKKDNDKTLRSTLGVEFKMNEGLWFEFAIGINGPSKDFSKNAKMLSLANVKYTFGKEKPRFDIP